MRYGAASVASFGLLLGVVLGAGCFDEPVSGNDSDCPIGEEGCSCLQNATCFGTLECVQGVCMSDGGETRGDGDGDEPGDGDGDGDEPSENVIVDMFAEACGITTTWTSHTPDPSPIPCDMPGEPMTGWMVRHPQVTVGGQTFEKVIEIVAPPQIPHFVRGLYNVDDISNPSMLEFRAEVLVRCAEGQAQCTGKFGLAIAEAIPNGLYAVIDDRTLISGEAPISMAVPLDALITLSEPAVGLVGERTEQAGLPSPQVLIVNPRLVLP